MDRDKAIKHFNEVIVPEWMPDIHSIAKSLHSKNEKTTRVSDPSELYEHGIMGLMSAFINWNPGIAKAHENSFRGYAKKCIEGHMRDAITGVLSHGRQGVIDPGIELQSRQFNRQQARKAQLEQPAQPEQAPATPALPDKPKV